MRADIRESSWDSPTLEQAKKKKRALEEAEPYNSNKVRRTAEQIAVRRAGEHSISDMVSNSTDSQDVALLGLPVDGDSSSEFVSANDEQTERTPVTHEDESKAVKNGRQLINESMVLEGSLEKPALMERGNMRSPTIVSQVEAVTTNTGMDTERIPTAKTAQAVPSRDDEKASRGDIKVVEATIKQVLAERSSRPGAAAVDRNIIVTDTVAAGAKKARLDAKKQKGKENRKERSRLRQKVVGEKMAARAAKQQTSKDKSNIAAVTPAKLQSLREKEALRAERMRSAARESPVEYLKQLDQELAAIRARQTEDKPSSKRGAQRLNRGARIAKANLKAFQAELATVGQ